MAIIIILMEIILDQIFINQVIIILIIIIMMEIFLDQIFINQVIIILIIIIIILINNKSHKFMLKILIKIIIKDMKIMFLKLLVMIL